jgi:hypothetical protein
VCPEVANLTQRCDTIVMEPAFLVIAVALPFAIVDTIETSRVYVFSRQFLDELPQRFTGPGRLCFILQPMLAILLGIRGGLRRCQGGKSSLPVRIALRRWTSKRIVAKWDGGHSHLLAVWIIMDVVFQLIIYRSVHPGAALLVGPILICFPYVLCRALTTGLARGMGEIRNATFLLGWHGQG